VFTLVIRQICIHYERIHLTDANVFRYSPIFCALTCKVITYLLFIIKIRLLRRAIFNIIILSLLTVASALMAIPLMAFAERTNLQPSIEVSGGYNDNISFSSQKQIADYNASFKPGLALEYGSETLVVEVDTYAELIRYSDETDFNTDNYWLYVNPDYKLSEKILFSADFSYLRDTTLDSELQDTGRVAQWELRQRNSANLRMEYKINELSMIDPTIGYTQTQYESENSVNRNVFTFSIPYYRWINYRIDKINIGPSFSTADIDNGRRIDDYKLNIGWDHRFQKTSKSQVKLGYGYTDINNDGGNTSSRNTGTAGLSLSTKGEVFSIKGGFKSDLRIDSQGELLEIDKIYLRLNKNWTEKVSLRLNGSITGSRPIDVYDRLDVVYFDVKPELMYKYVENGAFSIFYRYSNEYDDALSEHKYKIRNIIEFLFTYNFQLNN